MSSRDAVLLIHGLASPSALLAPLAYRLRSRGLSTMTWPYASLREDVEKLGRRLRERLLELEGNSDISRYHLVTHSMGSIVARVALNDTRLSRLGRIVMLAPPNRGSRVAAVASRVLGQVVPPLVQLSDTPDSVVHQIPEPSGYEIGVIAAARDRVVHIDSTQLDSQADHTIVRSGHTTILFRRDVAELTFRFLNDGNFGRRTN